MGREGSVLIIVDGMPEFEPRIPFLSYAKAEMHDPWVVVAGDEREALKYGFPNYPTVSTPFGD